VARLCTAGPRESDVRDLSVRRGKLIHSDVAFSIPSTSLTTPERSPLQVHPSGEDERGAPTGQTLRRVAVRT